MPDLRIVHLFGKPYRWYKHPGQPLELVPHVPLTGPPVASPADLYEASLRMMGGRLPWPFEGQTDA